MHICFFANKPTRMWKSAGPDGVCAEAITFSHSRIGIVLLLFFMLCLSHGYLPPAVIETTIVCAYC